MGLKKNCWAKVWEVKRREDKYTDIQVSTSRKNKNDEYETDFSGFLRLIGKAHEKAETLSDGDRIRIKAFEVTNKYDKEKKVTYTNYAVFQYDNGEDDDSDTSEEKESNSEEFKEVEDEEGDLPF